MATEEYGDPQDFTYEESMVNPPDTPTPARPEEAIARVREFSHCPMEDCDDITIHGTDDQPCVTYGDLRTILASLDALTQERDMWRMRYATAPSLVVQSSKTADLAALRERLARAEAELGPWDVFDANGTRVYRASSLADAIEFGEKQDGYSWRPARRPDTRDGA